MKRAIVLVAATAWLLATSRRYWRQERLSWLQRERHKAEFGPRHPTGWPAQEPPSGDPHEYRY